MAYVPKPLHHEWYEYGAIPQSGEGPPPAITIHALRANRRPIGYSAWPDDPPVKTKKKKRKKKK